MTISVRDAAIGDLERITDIYNQTIVDSHVSFDAEPWTVRRRKSWWEARTDDLVCLVAEEDGEVVGVTYASRYKPKTGYRSTVETTIALEHAATGRGIGTTLLGRLLDRVRADGFHRAIAIVALPNDASLALHRSLGYREVGTLTEVGQKLGRYVDTTILECDLTDGSDQNRP